MKARMTFAEYCTLDAVNFSTLKEMAKSPLHYRHRVETPRDDNARMAFGRAVHTAVFEPDRFPLEYVVYPGPRRAGKEWEEFAAVHTAHTILKADEYATALAVRDAVRGHKVAKRLLRVGEPEVSVTWTDPETGIDCKARPDWLTASTIVDLKTTGDVDATTFGRLAARMRYHVQGGFYREGVAANSRRRKPFAVKVIAAEAEAPFDVAVFDVDEYVLEASAGEAHEWLRALAVCRAAKKWPGRYPEEQRLDVPGWAFPNEEYTSTDVSKLGVHFAEVH